MYFQNHQKFYERFLGKKYRETEYRYYVKLILSPLIREEMNEKES